MDRLVAVLDRPLSDPFGEEFLVAQNQGMARWVAQQIAVRTGIAANLRFPLPARLVWDLLGCWFADLPAESDWDKERLLWRIFALLPGLAADPAFAEPARYLAGEPRELKTYQLARRISDLFDQYLVYRPDLVLDWEQGRGGDHWQARLWRRLAAEITTPHRAVLFARLAAALRDGTPPRVPLPERVLVFAPTALPPVYCQVLTGLAGLIPVHLFVLNPCREFWADLADEGRVARERLRALLAGAPDGSTLLDLGNPLLASWGHGGMAFQEQLLDMSDDWQDGFADPDPDHGTLLGMVQGDILDLRDRRRADPGLRTPLDPADESIQVQACHGRHREVQVLHDRLLRCFETLPDLKAREILCMAPDIDAYAPHIDAVFGAAPPERRIPWSIADRRLGAEQPLLAAVTELLGLPTARLGAAEVIGWLEVPAIARRFRLSAADGERIRTWIAETGVRWGLDGAMRADLGLPGEDANSWAFGLKRLFLGLALPPGDTLCQGVLPYPDLEGPETEALGGLADFIDTLGRWRRELARRRTLPEWCAALLRMLGDLCDPDEEEAERLLPLRTALESLARNAESAGLAAPVGLEVLRAEVAQVLDSADPAPRFLTGRVTFCNMVPMRSIPARVLYLLGMNATEFPRDQLPLSFDLMAAAPRRGDRVRREDDRHLFLEAVLSARDRLYLSYQGNDQHDNAVRVPSVLVEELLDYCRGSFCYTDGVQPLDRLLIRHPLQPFSRRLFDGSDPHCFSYRDDWCRAARAVREPGSDCFAAPGTLASAAPVADPAPGSLAALAPASAELDLDDLIRFLQMPPAWYLTRTLGLRPPTEDEALAEAEPFCLDSLSAWQLRQRLFVQAGEDRPAEAVEALLRAGGDLPHGAAAGVLLESEGARVAAFRAALAPLAAPPRPPLEVDLTIGGLRLTGWVEGLTSAGRQAYRLGRCRAADLLGLWVRHLVLNHLAPPGVAPTSTLVTELKDKKSGWMPETTLLAPVADPLAPLAALLAFYRTGCREPLPFFPETALYLARTGEDAAQSEAWKGRIGGHRGERDTWSIRTAFRGRSPLAPPFAALALQVFEPLLAAAGGSTTP